MNFFRVLASGYWAWNLAVLSNTTMYELSKLAGAHTEDRDLYSSLKKIYKFERVAPQPMVDLFDRLVPGSGAAWRSFFWDIIDNPQLSGAQLNEAITRLPLALREKISYLDKVGKPTKRKRVSSYGEIESIARISTLDALGVLLLLTQELKAILREAKGALWLKHYTIYCDIVWAADFLIARLAIFSPFRHLAEFLRKVVFTLILQCPERKELHNQIADMCLDILPNCSRDFSVVTRVGRYLLHEAAFNDVKFSSDQHALQFLYDRLLPISRCSIEELEEKFDLLLNFPFAHIIYDAISFGDIRDPYTLSDHQLR